MSNPYIGLQNDLVYALNQIVTEPGSLGIGLVKDEGKIRFVITGAGASNVIRVRGRINNQATWNTLAEFTGNVNELVEVFTYDQVEVLCVVFEASNGYDFKIVASSFDSNKLTIETPNGTIDNFNTLTLESSDNSIDIVADPLTGTIDLTTGESTGVTSVNGRVGDVILDKSDVGLDQVDNTSDADKPVSDATQDALDLKIDLLEKGAADGVAPLNSSSKIDAIYLPSYVDDVVEVADYASLPNPGEDGKIYVTLDTNLLYRWSGSVYVQVSESAVLSVNGEVGVVVLDKTHIGLGNVDNTSDLDKPISNDTQDALDLKEDLINKSINGTLSENSDTLYPSQKAVKTYVDAASDSLNDKLDASTYYHELHVNFDYTGTVVDGSPYAPYKTLQDAVNAAQAQTIGANTAILVHLKKDTVVTENVVVSNMPRNLYILSAVTNNNDSSPIRINGSLTISGATTTRVRVKDLQFYNATGYSLIINDTNGRHMFQNCQFSNGGIPGLAGTGVSLINTYRNFIEFSDCTIEGVVNLDGTPVANTSINFFRCRLGYSTLIVNSANISVGLYDTYGLYGLTHTAGALAITGLWGVIGFFNSTANLSATNFLSLSNVSLQKFDLSFVPLNKTGTCLYQLMTVHRGETADVLNGTRTVYGPTATDSAYKMGVSADWSPAVSNVAGALDQLADKKVTVTGDTMTGQLTMLDTAIVVDGTITQGYPSTVTVATNNVLLLDTSGVDNKETSISAGEIVLARTNVPSSTSDVNLTIGTTDGGYYLLANKTDYANDTQSELGISSYAVSLLVNNNATGDSTQSSYTTAGFSIQSTHPDSTYELIQADNTGITAIEYDGSSSIPLMPTLPEHYTVKEYVDNLVSSGETGIVEKFEIMKEPNGFPNRTDSTTSFVNASREFTISPVGASFDVYVKSQKFTKSAAETLEIPNMSGNHYIFYNDTGTLSSTQVLSSDLFQNNALISIVYWNADLSSRVYFAEERHGLTMDGATHTYLHTVFGARYLSGLALQNFSVNGDGNSDSHAQFTADSGSIRDEDLLITILAQSEIPVLYQQGQLWRKKAADAFPVIYSGTGGYTGASGRLPFNEYSGGAWQLTEIANNAFVLVHVFATNDKDNPVVAVQGIATYGNVTAARIAASTEITSLSGLPFAEFVALGSVVFESTSTYTNTPKARIRSINGGSYVDFRGTQLYTPAGEATTHSLLSGLAGDDHIQYHTDARGDARYNLKSVGDISETSFSITNNEPLQTDITNLSFDNTLVRSFQVILSVEIDADTDLSEVFELIGINKNGSFDMSVSSVGDDSGVVFSITSTGQIQYTSQNYTGFVSGTIKFRAITTSI
jgi:hypothetical protein